MIGMDVKQETDTGDAQRISGFICVVPRVRVITGREKVGGVYEGGRSGKDDYDSDSLGTLSGNEENFTRRGET